VLLDVSLHLYVYLTLCGHLLPATTLIANADYPAPSPASLLLLLLLLLLPLLPPLLLLLLLLLPLPLPLLLLLSTAQHGRQAPSSCREAWPGSTGQGS
jgi:hypothetical protein